MPSDNVSHTKRAPLASIDIEDHEFNSDDMRKLHQSHMAWDNVKNTLTRSIFAYDIGVFLARKLAESPVHYSEFVGAKVIEIHKVTEHNSGQINFVYTVDEQPEGDGALFARFGYDIALATD